MATRHEAEQLLTFIDLYRELTRDDATIVPPAPGTWLVVTVDERRRRHYRHSSDGEVWASGAMFPRMPYPSSIAGHRFLPDPGEDGAYLIVYGGGKEIFDADDVQEKTSTLLEELPHRIADIVCFQRPRRAGSTPGAASARQADEASVLWTVRGAGGIRRLRTSREDAMPFEAASVFASSDRWAPTVLETATQKEGT